jgi:hypothetical protein
MMVSFDGGATFVKHSAPAAVSTRVTRPGSAATFQTEMLQLNLAGGSLPPGVMIRESPTLASTGGTTIRPVTGGYMISSFFDVFTEISLDGGANWSPAQGAARVELRRDPATIPGIGTPSNHLPPRNDYYVSPAQYHAAFAAGIVIKDVKHSFFTRSYEPPVGGGTQIHDFGSQVDLKLSLNGGQTFTPARAQADVSVRVVDAGGGNYDTEMLQLDVHGGDLGNIRLRESPTEASRGQTELHVMPDGTFQITSFFDIFTELSLDGGANWQQPTSGPVHVELRCNAPEKQFPNPNLPPLTGKYVSPAQFHALYAQGIVISNVSHRRFTRNLPPPAPGASSTHSFNSDIDMMISLNGGATFTHAIAPAAVSVKVDSTVDDAGETRYFDTEMLSLNISGGNLPPGVMIRESPTRQSLGRTSIRQSSGGGGGNGGVSPPSDISSFFDIFTEVSLDGGGTWNPSMSGPVNMSLDFDVTGPCVGPSSLTVEKSTNGTSVIVSWSGTGYRLQSTEVLTTDPAQTVWQDITGASGISLPIEPGKRKFYRVICP